MPDLNSPLMTALSDFVIGPTSLRRIFLLLTRLHYSNPDNFKDLAPALQTFTWNKDPKLSRLFIDYDYNYLPTKLEQRPAIFVGIGDISYRKVAQNNQNQNVSDNSGVKYTNVADTGLFIRHISSTPDEALGLADLTGAFFMGIRTLLEERLRLQAFDVIQLVSSHPFMREATDPDPMFKADIIAKLSWTCEWITFRESHRIKTITFGEALSQLSIPSRNDSLAMVDSPS